MQKEFSRLPISIPKKIITAIFVGLIFQLFCFVSLYIFPNNLEVKATIIISVGLGIIAYSLFWLLEIFSTKKWLPVNGKVIKSTINVTRGFSEISNASEFYNPSISYQYEIEGQTFQSNIISIFNYEYTSNYDESLAKDILEKFPEGKVVTVWVHPKKPAYSVLIHGCKKENMMTFIGYITIGCIIILFGLFYLFY